MHIECLVHTVKDHMDFREEHMVDGEVGLHIQEGRSTWVISR